jgi:hypothetical protein
VGSIPPPSDANNQKKDIGGIRFFCQLRNVMDVMLLGVVVKESEL